jgi:hypothetical protein
MKPIQKHCQTVMSTHHILEAKQTHIESRASPCCFELFGFDMLVDSGLSSKLGF